VRVAAVDWSGRARGASRFIWTAVAGEDGLRLQGGRDRDETGDLLIELALSGPELVVGLDFGFSLPLWFLDREGLRDGLAVTEDRAEGWLRECPPPFWGRRGRQRGPEVQRRRTEVEVAPAARPVFQVGGAGAVGTASLRGFPLLRRLRAEGFSIWPFDAPRTPVAVEIYPRLLTGPVVKSSRPAREAYLRTRGWPLEPALSEDAFDAAVSALVMSRNQTQLASLPREADPVYAREGRIWTAGAGRTWTTATS
jgi:hypothetical protein